MGKISFIALDPSLANTGLVWGHILESGEVVPVGFTLISTSKGKGSVSSDTVNRCRQTIEGITKLIDIVQPDVCFAESPSGSQSAAAMKSYGVSCSYIALLPEPVIQVTPFEIKKVVNGTNSASKHEVMAFVESLYPDFVFARKKDGSLVSTRMEHICDAIAAALAGVQTSEYRKLRDDWN